MFVARISIKLTDLEGHHVMEGWPKEKGDAVRIFTRTRTYVSLISHHSPSVNLNALRLCFCRIPVDLDLSFFKSWHASLCRCYLSSKHLANQYHWAIFFSCGFHFSSRHSTDNVISRIQVSYLLSQLCDVRRLRNVGGSLSCLLYARIALKCV